VTALTGRLLGYFPQDSDEWHAARATRIGASEIGAICGWSPWQTRADVMARKLGQTERTPQTKAQQRGHLVAGTSQIPLTYAAQCMWLLHVLGADVCHVAVLFGQPFLFKRYKIRRDDAVIAYLVREADAFHADLLSALNERSAA
jgi:predicted phage-related endonuclease